MERMKKKEKKSELRIQIVQILFIGFGLYFYGIAIISQNLLIMIISTLVIFKSVFIPKL